MMRVTKGSSMGDQLTEDNTLKQISSTIVLPVGAGMELHFSYMVYLKPEINTQRGPGKHHMYAN